MSKARKTTILVVVAFSGACCFACAIAVLAVFSYQPAVVAAPGREMRWPTKPDLLGSVVKRFQATLDIRPCDLAILGWNLDGELFYQESCQGGPFQVWAYDPDQDRRPRPVAAAPANLVQETLPRSAVLERVRVPSVRPTDAEPMVRNLEVRVDGLASPDGRWVAVVARHVYGPEDVIVLE